MRVKARYGLVYSTRDLAGTGIAEHVISIGGFDIEGIIDGRKYFRGLNGKAVLASFDEDVIYFDFLDKYINANVFIVLSRHSSEARVKTLSAHHPGNPTEKALYGGKPLTLAYSSPIVLSVLFRKLYEIASRKGLIEEYDVVLEATHHGPTDVSKPVVFIEIGSSEEEWKDERAREVVALAVVEAIKLLEKNSFSDVKIAIGFGGGHYPRKFTTLVIKGEYCLGHILAKYALDKVRRDVIEQMVYKSNPRPEYALIEKKSVKSAIRRDITELVGELGLKVIYV